MLIPLPVRMGCRCVLLGPALCGSLAAGASQVTAGRSGAFGPSPQDGFSLAF